MPRRHLPVEVEALLDRTLLFHCSVCLAEFATGVANGNPAYPQWAVMRDQHGELVAAIPPSRLLTPDPARSSSRLPPLSYPYAGFRCNLTGATPR